MKGGDFSSGSKKTFSGTNYRVNLLFDACSSYGLWTEQQSSTDS
ncbi:hypothetical protein SBF1_2510002 [Candidatus Desulfosporosinus infrequens]|uniref:Uncharacterized protein n=1 Tax=Candidatus Desulfosporosinus infrequens TaxID=2043169 RepID=A0A2U3KPC8_9FIRM|nr:hypothetical protein SBF1_2510002 [Candidatus Desulfosporosinus infrequens]